jgi:chromosome partitioning protein
MTRVISFLNLQQGGGKTTTVLNLATALKRRGHNVLAVDLSADETLYRRVRMPNPSRSARVENQVKIVSTMEGWHLMRSAASLSLLHARTLSRLTPGGEFDDELLSLLEAYDYVLADCSTQEVSLIAEILACTDEVIVPLDSESLQFHDAVERIAELFSGRLELNPQLKFGGVFLARYAPRFRRAREMLTTMLDALGPVNCFSAYLPESNAIRQAEGRRVSVITDAPTSQAAHAFYQLAEQLTNASVPRVQTPTLLVMPGRALVEESSFTGDAALAPSFEPVVFLPENLPTWRERAETGGDMNQAVRYAVLALLERPDDAAALELFESRLMQRLETARYADLDRLVELGQFLAEHELDHYAAQLLRRATELNPAHLRAWADLARLAHSEAERAFALEQCLGLDQGLAAAEAPPLPRRGQRRGDAPPFASPFGPMQTANA